MKSRNQFYDASILRIILAALFFSPLMNMSKSPLHAMEKEKTFVVQFDMFEGYPEILFYDNADFLGESEYSLSSKGLYSGSEIVCEWNGSATTRPADEILINPQNEDGNSYRCDKHHLFNSDYMPCGGHALFEIHYNRQLASNRFSKLVDNRVIYFEIISNIENYSTSEINDFSESNVECP